MPIINFSFRTRDGMYVFTWDGVTITAEDWHKRMRYHAPDDNKDVAVLRVMEAAGCNDRTGVIRLIQTLAAKGERITSL